MVLLLAPLVFAEEQLQQRELSNISVVGVERMEVPTQRDSFSMIQYMPDPIQGFNRGSLKCTSSRVLDNRVDFLSYTYGTVL